MAAGDDDSESSSTIVRRGQAAFSYSEMERFVRELEARPLDRLVADLPGLLELPEAKFGLVAMTVAKRMRLSSTERTALEQRLRECSRTAAAETRKRCESLLASRP
jgi:hypothetical protein